MGSQVRATKVQRDPGDHLENRKYVPHRVNNTVALMRAQEAKMLGTQVGSSSLQVYTTCKLFLLFSISIKPPDIIIRTLYDSNSAGLRYGKGPYKYHYALT
jgi:hypothetical protein